MIVLLLLYYVTAITSATKATFYSLNEGSKYFEDFIKAHNKVYSSDEEKAMRYEIFLKNLEEINMLNAENEYTEFGVNKFTDLTLEEFLKRQMPFSTPSEYLKSRRAITPAIKSRNEVLEIPTHFDWRDKNVVTSVKDQGQCNAPYAFTIAGNLESLFAIKTGKLINLSAQQLVDCDVGGGGCGGGEVSMFTYWYLMDQGPMSSESYPYNASENDCMYDPEKVAVNVTNYHYIRGGEDEIAKQLVAIGPLSIAVDPTPLHHYKSGVLNGKDCQYINSVYPVLLVGYGVDSASGLSYWLAKNSWGADFGEQGYFRMQRGVVCLGFPQNQPITGVIG